MKEILQILRSAVLSMALSGLMILVSLYFVLAQIVELETTVTISIGIGIIFFIINTIMIINTNQKEIPTP